MAHYIDADILLEELERLCRIAIEAYDPGKLYAEFWNGKVAAYQEFNDIIATLRHEQKPKGYDESYLNKCIAKASKTWENVDVDKYMDEVRGREQEQPEVDLEKEIDEWFDSMGEAWENGEWSTNDIKSTARHFFELGRKAKEESK